MKTHTNYKAEFSFFFFLQGNIAFLCNFKIKIDQTDHDISSIFKSNRERFLCLHSLADKTQEGFGEFKTVMVL